MVLLTVFLTLYLGQYATGKLLRAIRYTAILDSLAYGVSVLLRNLSLYVGIEILPGLACFMYCGSIAI